MLPHALPLLWLAAISSAQNLRINKVETYKGDGSFFDGQIQAGGYLQVELNVTTLSPSFNLSVGLYYSSLNMKF